MICGKSPHFPPPGEALCHYHLTNSLGAFPPEHLSHVAEVPFPVPRCRCGRPDLVTHWNPWRQQERTSDPTATLT